MIFFMLDCGIKQLLWLIALIIMKYEFTDHEHFCECAVHPLLVELMVCFFMNDHIG